MEYGVIRKKLDRSTQRFSIQRGREQISFRTFLDLLKKDSDFILFFNQILVDCPFPAFFFEVKPTRSDLLDHRLEFVLISAPALERVSADQQTFASYFKGQESVVLDFSNLGGDAHLIVPRPHSTAPGFAHIGIFCREAEDDVLIQFWKRAAEVYSKLLEEDKGNLWLSTSGLGVFWLHMRVDSFPKYYQFSEFRRAPS